MVVAVLLLLQQQQLLTRAAAAAAATDDDRLWIQRHRRPYRPPTRWIRPRRQAALSQSKLDHDDDHDDSRDPIVVVGLGRSGRSAAVLAAFQGERVVSQKNKGRQHRGAEVMLIMTIDDVRALPYSRRKAQM